MIPVLAILHYSRTDLLERCLKSIDYPIGRLIVIDGGNDSLKVKAKPDSGFHYIRVPGGGVSSGINLTIKTFSAPWWFISSNDVEYRPGDLAKMAEAANARHLERSCFYGNLMAAYQIITRKGVEEVGLYDENFYPMYLEDYDWQRRARLAALFPEIVEGCDTLHGMKGECSSTVNSDPALKEKNDRNWPILTEYYCRKWGGAFSKEMFTKPFGNPNFPLSYWNYEPELRERLRW